MTTTGIAGETSNYTRVAPSPGSANGNGNRPGSAEGGPNAQPRVRARARVPSVAGGVVAVRDVPANVPATVDEDRPDLWRRTPLSLAQVWDRHVVKVAAYWAEGDWQGRAAAVLLAVLFAVPSIAVVGLFYGLAFCVQEPPRAAWFALAAAVLSVLIIRL